MHNIISKVIDPEEQRDFRNFIYVLTDKENKLLLHNDIVLAFNDVCKKEKKSRQFQTESSIAKLLKRVMEMLVLDDLVLIVHRYAIAKYRIYQLDRQSDYMEEIDVPTFLDYKDRFVLGSLTTDGEPLRIDFMPFYDYSPSMRDSKRIGNGISYLNKHLSSSLFQNPEKWKTKLFEFIALHKINKKQMLVNGALFTDVEPFIAELERLMEWLEKFAPDKPYAEVRKELSVRGFEAGWGSHAGRIRESMHLLYDLFTEPDSKALESFISRIPMISKIAVISPHGWFGQENVLGKPDTGGQVIYILDQVRALERHLLDEFSEAGINVVPKIIVLTRLIPDAAGTACDQRLEKIHRTDNSWILRIPFRDNHHRTVDQWMSRFRIWPFLERFAEDGERELVAEFQDRPDLIIGNYSDGNLVATMLSDRLNVIQCTIAHALEKTKYLFSDMYWKKMEDDYHFSLQFTADMIAMNKSDFIITSTYQEIAGTDTTIGQYESYQYFTMPDLYQVVSGVNLFNPKFNVVPPGVDESNYFPFFETDKRVPSRTEFWRNRLFADDHDEIHGHLTNPDKPPIFTMARLDRIKNIPGLIEAFGGNSELGERCNLIIAGGTTKFESSQDHEEQDQIRRIYELIERFNLEGRVRWLPAIPKKDTGVVYQIVADQRGIFVQPALFEAFGLTVLEAMLCGLPTFATEFGGPSEIIRNGKSGFLINPSKPELMGEIILKFFKRCEKDAGLWETISNGGIARVRENFTWDLYSKRLVSLTKLYGFWRYSVSGEGMKKMDRYADLIYHCLFKSRLSGVS